jgi:hypothetical protein
MMPPVHPTRRGAKAVGLLAGAVLTLTIMAAPASAALKVDWMKGYVSPGTPKSLNKVGVLKLGPRLAKNVLVLEPGTSAGAGYFVPFAKWVVAHALLGKLARGR